MMAIPINNPHAALNKRILIKLLMENLKYTQKLTENYTEPSGAHHRATRMWTMLLYLWCPASQFLFVVPLPPGLLESKSQTS